jgi:hypothetical protein
MKKNTGILFDLYCNGNLKLYYFYCNGIKLNLYSECCDEIKYIKGETDNIPFEKTDFNERITELMNVFEHFLTISLTIKDLYKNVDFTKAKDTYELRKIFDKFCKIHNKEKKTSKDYSYARKIIEEQNFKWNFHLLKIEFILTRKYYFAFEDYKKIFQLFWFSANEKQKAKQLNKTLDKKNKDLLRDIINQKDKNLILEDKTENIRKQRGTINQYFNEWESKSIDIPKGKKEEFYKNEFIIDKPELKNYPYEKFKSNLKAQNSNRRKALHKG